MCVPPEPCAILRSCWSSYCACSAARHRRTRSQGKAKGIQEARLPTAITVTGNHVGTHTHTPGRYSLPRRKQSYCQLRSILWECLSGRGREHCELGPGWDLKRERPRILCRAYGNLVLLSWQSGGRVSRSLRNRRVEFHRTPSLWLAFGGENASTASSVDMSGVGERWVVRVCFFSLPGSRYQTFQGGFAFSIWNRFGGALSYAITPDSLSLCTSPSCIPSTSLRT